MSATGIDSSQLRHYYLQQIGITAYVPRDLQLQPQQSAAMTPKSEASVRPRLLVVEDEPAQSAARTVAAGVVQAASTDPADMAPAPFRLLFSVLDAELAIALQIPALSATTLREPELRLLQNLLRWLGYSAPEAKALLQYRWPLPGVGATDAATATRTLNVFMQQAASAQSFRHLVVLGAAPAQFLQQSDIGWQLWCTHSLAEMLAMPQLKRDVWLMLQPLWQQLQQRRN